MTCVKCGKVVVTNTDDDFFTCDDCKVKERVIKTDPLLHTWLGLLGD